jgi:hypothetical protein
MVASTTTIEVTATAAHALAIAKGDFISHRIVEAIATLANREVLRAAFRRLTGW